MAIFILLSDSKLYTAFSKNLLYVFIPAMLLTFVIGKKHLMDQKAALGGGFNLQPAAAVKYLPPWLLQNIYLD